MGRIKIEGLFVSPKDVANMVEDECVFGPAVTEVILDELLYKR